MRHEMRKSTVRHRQMESQVKLTLCACVRVCVTFLKRECFVFPMKRVLMTDVTNGHLFFNPPPQPTCPIETLHHPISST